MSPSPGASLVASDTYQIGYATQDTGCSSGFTAFTGLSVQTDANGNFAAHFCLALFPRQCRDKLLYLCSGLLQHPGAVLRHLYRGGGTAASHFPASGRWSLAGAWHPLRADEWLLPRLDG